MELSPPSVEIVEKPALSVAGLECTASVENPNTHAEIGAMWHRFVQELLKVEETFDVMYGVSDMISATEFRYLACVTMAEDASLPPGFVRWSIPASQYAVFTHRGDVQRIRDTYTAAGAWLSASTAFQNGEGPNIERYDERFRENSPDSILEIFVPVVPISTI